jgi:phosphotriesterase-related protein
MSHPQWAAEATIEDLRDLFIRDVLVGVDGTGICSGIIGEIGTSGIVKTASGSGLLGERSGHITAQEEKVLRAAAQAARFAGVAVTVHLHPTTKGAFRILEVLADEGLSPDRIVIGHVDWIEDYAYHKAIAETGVWVEFDSLGRERYVPGFGWSGTDEWRVDHLARLCEEGFDGQLVVSQDCCLKMDLRKYGGMGYGHILQNIIPMMQERGIAKHRVDKLLIDNPRRILTVLPGEFE